MGVNNIDREAGIANFIGKTWRFQWNTKSFKYWKQNTYYFKMVYLKYYVFCTKYQVSIKIGIS